MPTVTIELPPLHDGQRTVAECPAQFINLACGRRWGKSILLGNLCYKRAMDAGARAWWVYPNFPTALPAWRYVDTLATQIRQRVEGVRIRQMERRVILPGGAEVMVKSADDPKTLVAEGLVFAAVDECGIIQKRAVEESLEPTLIDHDGSMVLAGVPKGRGWWSERFAWGESDSEPDWASFNFSTFDNPTLPPESLERLRQRYERGLIPERIWRQEYLGEFIDDAGMVFRKVADALGAVWQDKAEPGHEYVFGVDWGKSNDFTVFAVWDLTLQHLVHIDRDNKVDYAVQVGRLDALASRFKPVRILAERNSMGEPLIEQLQRKGLPVEGFLTTNETKAEAIEALALAIERGDVQMVPDEHLVGELQAYERKQLPSGRPQYGAPAGLHDDVVMASAIGYSGARTGGFGMMVL